MKYIIRRALQTLFSLWLLASISFFLLQIFPGSPFDDEISLHPSVVEQINRTYGLDKSTISQYTQFLLALGQGNFGASQFYQGKQAGDIILNFFPTTLILSSLSLAFALCVGVALALLSELNRIGYLIYESLTLLLLSMPLLLLGPLLIYIFAFYFNLLPAALLEDPSSYILPVVVLSLKPLSSIARIFRTSLMQVKMTDYNRTRRAFGFSEANILFKSTLRNSLIPLISYLGPLAALMLTGSTMVEIVFAIPGMGTQFIDAALNRDASLVIGLTLFYGFFIFIFQWVVDVLISILDPRVQLQ